MEHSATPIGRGPPLATPATSTPKYNQSNMTTRRQPLEFVSGDERKPRPHLPKVSQSVSSIVLGTHSRVVEGRTPRSRKSGGCVVRNMQHSLQFTSMQRVDSGKANTSESSMAKSEECSSTKLSDAGETEVARHDSAYVTGGNCDGSAIGKSSTSSRGNSIMSKSSSSREELQHVRDKASLVSKTLSSSMEVGVSPHFPPSRSVTPAKLTDLMTTKACVDKTDRGSVPSDLTGPRNQSRHGKGLAQCQEMSSPVPTTYPHVHPPQPPPAPPTISAPSSSQRPLTRSFNSSKSNPTSSPLSSSLAPPVKKQKPNAAKSGLCSAAPSLQSKKKSVGTPQSKAKPAASTRLQSPPPSPLTSSASPVSPVGSKHIAPGSKRATPPCLVPGASKKRKTEAESKSYSKSKGRQAPEPKKTSTNDLDRSKGNYSLRRKESLPNEQTKNYSGRSNVKPTRESIVHGRHKATNRMVSPILPPHAPRSPVQSVPSSISPVGEENQKSPYTDIVAHYEIPFTDNSSTTVHKQKSNASFSSNWSMASNKSRTALADVYNTCLNRGGQQRMFNLSGAPKPRKRKRSQKQNNISAGSLPPISAPISEHDLNDLNAIPDSMPLDTSLKSNISSRSNASSIRKKYTRACLCMDMSWEQSPTEDRATVSKSKTGRTGQKKCPPVKKVLASARTKKGPNGLTNLHVSNFGITESDFEKVDSTKPATAVPPTKPKGSKKGRGAGKKSDPVNLASLKKDFKSTVAEEDSRSVSRRRIWMKTPTLPPEGTRERQAIDDIYEPQVSPEPENLFKTTSVSSKTKTTKQPKSNNSSKGTTSKTQAKKYTATTTAKQKSFPAGTRSQRKTTGQPRSYAIYFSDNQDTDVEEPPKKVPSLSSRLKDKVEPTRRQPRRRVSCIKTYSDGSLTDGYMTDTSDLDDDDDDRNGDISEIRANPRKPSETLFNTLTKQNNEFISPRVKGSTSKFISPLKSVLPLKSISPSESVSPSKSVSPLKSTMSISPLKSIGSISPSMSISPLKSTRSILPSKSISPIKSTKSILPSKSNLPSKSISPAVFPPLYSPAYSPVAPPSPPATNSSSASNSSSQENVSPGHTPLLHADEPADSNVILQGFESVCRQLVAHSKTKGLPNPRETGGGGQSETRVLRDGNDELDSSVEDGDEVTLTQFSRVSGELYRLGCIQLKQVLNKFRHNILC